MKTNKTLVLLLISFFALRSAFSQNFEGTLSYSVKMEVSEKMQKYGVTKEILIEKMRKEGTWADTIFISYKNGNYIQQMGINKFAWSVYSVDSNKLYSFQKGSDICTVINTSIDLEEEMFGTPPKISLLDTSVVINDLECSIVRVKWKSGYYDYYFNTLKNPISPEFYKLYKYDGWYEYLKIAKSLPIRIVKSNKGMMTITMTLVNTSLHNVNDDLFKIPKLVYEKDLNIVPIKNRVIMRVIQ